MRLEIEPHRERLTAFAKDKWPYLHCAVFVWGSCFIPGFIVTSLIRGGDFSGNLIIPASISLLGALAGIDAERHGRWVESRRRLHS